MFNKRIKRVLLVLIVFFTLSPEKKDWAQCQETWKKERIVSSSTGKVPKEWREVVRGVKTKLNADQKVLALTFDAYGGLRSNGYDAKFINLKK